MQFHLVHGQTIDFEVSLLVDVQAGEPLEVGNPQGGEGLIVVHMEPVDGNVEVAAKQEANSWGGQHPVVCQHPQVVGSNLQQPLLSTKKELISVIRQSQREPPAQKQAKTIALNCDAIVLVTVVFRQPRGSVCMQLQC